MSVQPKTDSADEKGNQKYITITVATAQTLFWASTFYLLPALLPVLEQETNWTKPHITGAFTSGLILSALASPIVGRGIDLGYGQAIMSICATITGLVLLVFSFSHSLISLYICWLLLGLCMAGMLYEPCFAIITRHRGKNARRAITHITLIAGFAGTLSFPLANYLAHHFGWEKAVQAFVLLVLFVGLPLNWSGMEKLFQNFPTPTRPKEKGPNGGRTYGLLFWYLAFAFTLGGINQGMITTHLLPLLVERGIGQSSAIIAAMLIGPMQVVGRFALMQFEEKISAPKTGLICLGGLTLSTLFLYLAGATLPFIFIATSLQGATWGLISIARPSITQEMLGQENFGAISGRMGGIFVFGIALAPALGSQLWQLGGYNLMLLTGVALALSGFALLNIAYQIKQ